MHRWKQNHVGYQANASLWLCWWTLSPIYIFSQYTHFSQLKPAGSLGSFISKKKHIRSTFCCWSHITTPQTSNPTWAHIHKESRKMKARLAIRMNFIFCSLYYTELQAQIINLLWIFLLSFHLPATRISNKWLIFPKKPGGKYTGWKESILPEINA